MIKKYKLQKRESVLILMLLFYSVVVVGGIMNYVAIMSNDCRMPVKTNNYIDTETHFSFYDKSEINNYFLLDIIPWGKNVSSIGDIFMVGGFILFFYFSVYYVILIKRDKKNERKIYLF